MVAKRRTVVTFGLAFGGVLVATGRTVVAFGLASRRRSTKVSTLTGMGGWWSRHAEASSLLDLPLDVASQKCQL